jgi:hypothetical protein
MAQITITITSIASTLNLAPVGKTLPNGKVVKAVEWAPSHLPAAFRAVEEARGGALGREDVVVFDGAAPGWLLACIVHAAHPANASVKYPQGGPDCVLPISGARMADSGYAEGVKFKVTENPDYTSVEFSLANPSIDVAAALATLLAPEVPAGKPVRISGRGPIAILAALASAYAHLVPEVAAFQPGTGNVVAISHGGSPLGTVVP